MWLQNKALWRGGGNMASMCVQGEVQRDKDLDEDPDCHPLLRDSPLIARLFLVGCSGCRPLGIRLRGVEMMGRWMIVREAGMGQRWM